MSIVSAVIVLFFAVVGAAAVCRTLSLRFFSVKNDYTVMYVTRIQSSDENAEFILRSALSKRRWSSKDVSKGCLDCPMDDKTRKICEGVCREYGIDCLMTKDEFLKSLD